MSTLSSLSLSLLEDLAGEHSGERSGERGEERSGERSGDRLPLGDDVANGDLTDGGNNR